MYLILAFIVIGMAAGWLAHFVVEPHRRVNWPVLFVAGLAGSFIGGLIVSLIAGNGLAPKPSGIIGTVAAWDGAGPWGTTKTTVRPFFT